MRREGEVRQKLKQILYRYRKAYIKSKLSPRPENCTHNTRKRLPIVGESSVRVCKYKGNDWVCDERLGGLTHAQSCPHFEATADPEELKEYFKRNVEGLVQDPNAVGILAQQYPDAMALMWVLGLAPGDLLTDLEGPATDDPEDHPTTEPPSPSRGLDERDPPDPEAGGSEPVP